MRYLKHLFYVIVFLFSFSNPDAQANNISSDQDIKELETLCLQKNTEACESLTYYYDNLARSGGNNSISASQAWKLKIDWAEHSCNSNGQYGCDAAGWAYEHGAESRSQDYIKAARFYEMGCQINSALSCNNYALAVRFGRGIEENEATAQIMFNKACNLGFNQACSNVSKNQAINVANTDNTLNSEDVSLQEQNNSHTVPVSKETAQLNETDAQYVFGAVFYNGYGVPKSETIGVEFFQKSAKSGHAAAATDLGWAYEVGAGGLTQNMQEAVRWYRIGAERGSRMGQYNMGNVYSAGLTVPRSDKEALIWYQRAAEQGHPQAATNVGLFYEQGRGITKNMKVAVNWYRRAAEAGDVNGMTNYAYARLSGMGEEKSYEEAYKWFTKAAQKNNARAQYNLGTIYELGQGVPASNTQALYWYEEAAAQNFQGASEKVANIKQKNTALANQQGTTSKEVSTSSLRCDQGNAALCRKQYESALKKCNDPSQPESSRKAYCEGYGYFASLGCTAGDSELCFISGQSAEYGKGWNKIDLQAAKIDYEKGCSRNHEPSCTALNRLTGSSAITSNLSQPKDVLSMDNASLDNACGINQNFDACVELYKRVRGEANNGYVIAEYICDTWNRGEYCFEAGADLLLGNGNTPIDYNRAYANFHSGCYKRHYLSCYQGGNIKLSSARNSNDFYDAMMLFDIACNAGYRDSCALKRSSQRGGDTAVSQANQRLRENHDDALRCEKTRIVGNGGRTHISYDCRTNLEWKLGKKR